MKASYKVGSVVIFCYLVAWLDRMAINMAVPFMMKDLDLNATEVGWIMSAFFAGYALFQIPGGILADKIGARKVIIGALGWWSLFTAATGAVFSLPAMLVTRFLFGVGEGIFPAAVWKIIASWFTKKNRATVNGIVLSAVAAGPALTPLILAPVIENFGWRAAFYMLGGLGVVCVLLSARYVTNHIHEYRGISKEEVDEYEADAKSALAIKESSLDKSSLGDLLRTPVLWALFITLLCIGITIYGYLGWLPVYLLKVKGMNIKEMAMGASVPFIFATIGMASSGWISDKYFRGRRKYLVLLDMVFGGIALYYFTQITDVATFMVLQCFAAFLLFQALGSIWTLPMILLPTHLFGAGSGFINTAAQIGGFLSGILIGWYISFRGGDFSAGFDVMLGALVISIIAIAVGVHEKKVDEVADIEPERSKA